MSTTMKLYEEHRQRMHIQIGIELRMLRGWADLEDKLLPIALWPDVRAVLRCLNDDDLDTAEIAMRAFEKKAARARDAAAPRALT